MYLLNGLLNIQNEYSNIREVRGRGLMLAIEFDSDINGDLIDRIYYRLLDEGFIIARRPGLNVFRVDPPFVIQKEEIDRLSIAYT